MFRLQSAAAVKRLALVLVVCSGGYCIAAQAQSLEEDAVAATTPAPPYSLFQYSVLTGSGNTISATYVPVVTSTGTVYKNVTLAFTVDSKGNLAVAPGYPQVLPVPPVLTSNFRPGKYVGPSTIYNGQMIINVSGPNIAPGGATEWSLAAASGATYGTYPDSANWYVEPIASTPIAARLAKAGITSKAYSYGIGGSNYGVPWGQDGLLGFAQIGNSLTIVSFTDSAGDHSQPVAQVTYTRTQ